MTTRRRSFSRLEAESTQSQQVSDRRTEERSVPGMTIAWHPDVGRIGERVVLFELAEGAAGTGARVELSRLSPRFASPEVEPYPLADRGLSRRPVLLSRGTEPGSVRIAGAGSGLDLVIDGRTLASHETVEIDLERLRRGVTLLLSRRVALLLHSMRELSTPTAATFGLVGQSCALRRVRAEIRKVAGLEIPVLLRGATGTGKELVARAVHQNGPRSGGPFLAVNLAAIPPSLAAAELFGAARGAYTGADAATPGYFRRAAGGTLFLDEIGEIPGDLQALLLRTLETGEIQPVGGGKPVAGSARIVAATDADLEATVAEGRFRAPLLHRLASYTIRLPDLAARREDIGSLLVHFLRRELETLGRSSRLGTSDDAEAELPWLAASLVARLTSYDWPGNVRELRNVARHLAVAWSDHPRVPEEAIDDLLAEPAEAPGLRQSVSPGKRSPETGYKPPSEIGDEELLAALRSHRFATRPTARALGISRTSLYRLIEDSPKIRKAADLGTAEIRAALAEHGGDLRAAALFLEVSARGLGLRCAELGIDRLDPQARPARPDPE